MPYQRPPIEHKTIPCELKVAGEGGSRLAGTGAVFLNVDAGRDIIAPGAFSKDLDDFINNGFVGGLNHNWDQPIARIASAAEGKSGLEFESEPIIDTTHGQDVRKLVNAGVIRKSSIGYRALEFKHLDGPDEVKAFWKGHGYTPSASDLERAAGRTRVLTRVKLFEVSPVSVPMNDRATISAIKMFGHDMPGGDGPVPTDPALRIFVDHLLMKLAVVLGDDLAPAAERLGMIGPAFDAVRDGVIRYATPYLGSDDAADEMAASVEAMSRQIKASLGLAPDPDTPGILADAASAVGPDAYLPMVESALTEFRARHRARLDIRLKEGRVLSAANVNRMAAMRDSLHGHADGIDEMLSLARPKGDADASSPGEPDNSGSAAEVKMVVPFLSGPVLEGAWTGDDAKGRVQGWAGGPDKESIDWAKYQSAFTFVDDEGKGRNLGAYHLLHHDVDGGSLKVHRRGVFAAAAIVQGGRGGPPKGATADDLDGIRSHLGKHYKQDLKMEAPWDRQGKAWTTEELEAGGISPAEAKSLGWAVAGPPPPPDRVDPSEVKRLFLHHMHTVEAPRWADASPIGR